MKKLTIKTILVPIDFSSSSMNALQTAVAIAKQHGSVVHLLHVVDKDYELFKDDHHIVPPLLSSFTKKIEQLSRSVHGTDNISCSYSVEYGSITHKILRTSIALHADLIILGKNGSNGASLEFAGTQTCQVSEKSRIPVMIIPDHITKYDFENILFPVRPLLSGPDKYDALRSFFMKTNPKINVLHLRNPEYQDELNIIHQLSQILEEKLKHDKVSYNMEYYFKDYRFAERVLEVMSQAENRPDLAVITAELDKSNKDFHVGYYAQKIIHQCSIPVLVMHPDTPKLSKAKIAKKLGIPVDAI